MQLGQLLERVPGVVLCPGRLDVEISSITSDSRQVSPGALFVAYRGVGTDAHRYITDALARGAAAVVGESPVEALAPSPGFSVPYVQVTDGRAALAWLHAAWYGHPSRSMTLIGITGTDGKTTTSNLLFSILKAAGIRSGMISTVNAIIGNRTYDTGLHTTTPDSADVQRYLAEMRDAGTEVVVLETTSHGLAQHRVTGADYDVAVVTNITHEHLDFHGSFDAYREAKATLFRSLLEPHRSVSHSASKPLRTLAKTAVLNADDSSYAYLGKVPAERYIAYTALAQAPATPGAAAAHVAILRASQLHQAPAGMSFDVEWAPETGSLTRFPLTTRLVGRFNVSNVLAAVGAALALGIDEAPIGQGVAALSGVPGRMERIDLGQPFTAIVDFAHTPNALSQALATGRDLVGADQRVIVVFGSAGLRDVEKRRLMGEVAAQAADYTVITAEDPRTEDLAAILADTADAMTRAGRVEGVDFVRVPDRQAAILHAVREARANDVLMVCGKGHEQSMCFGTVEHPWRDQEALAWALARSPGQPETNPPFMLPTWPGSTSGES